MLVFQNGSTIRVGNNGPAMIDDVVISPTVRVTLTIVLRLKNGQVWLRYEAQKQLANCNSEASAPYMGLTCPTSL